MAETKMVKSVTSLTDIEQSAADQIYMVMQECNLSQSTANGIVKAFSMARAVNVLRKMITDELMREYIMPLMNNRMGFLTDKDPRKPTAKNPNPQPYPLSVVKDCFIEACLCGAQPVGNEFNIIAGNTYLTQAFFFRAVGEIPGVTDVRFSPGIPLFDKTDQGSAKIRCGLSWKKDGIEDSLKDADGKPGRVFDIEINAWLGPDAVVGKAMRKTYAAAYRQITGSRLSIPDAEVGDTKIDQVAAGTVKALGTEALKERLKERTAPKNESGELMKQAEGNAAEGEGKSAEAEVGGSQESEPAATGQPAEGEKQETQAVEWSETPPEGWAAADVETAKGTIIAMGIDKGGTREFLAPAIAAFQKLNGGTKGLWGGIKPEKKLALWRAVFHGGLQANGTIG